MSWYLAAASNACASDMASAHKLESLACAELGLMHGRLDAEGFGANAACYESEAESKLSQDPAPSLT
eukprot:3747980-Pleurochrysis_carterae.AAC.1